MTGPYRDPARFREENDRLGTGLPFTEDLSPLAQPFSLEGKTVPNRLAAQPMEGCDGTPDGRPGEYTLRRYRRIARGGVGLIWLEACAVLPEGRANPRQLWLRKETLDDFKALADEIRETALRERGAVPILILQLTHSGRYSKPRGVPEPLIAYRNPVFEKNAPIDPDRIVSDAYLDRVGEALVKGAELVKLAGFDGADLKCCHRYLASELLSAFERPGRYGGPLENRARLLLESVKGAKSVCGRDFIVTTRLNAYDGFPRPWGFGAAQEGSEFDPFEAAWILRELYKRGVRLANITMGNPYFNPHVNRPFAAGGYEPPEEPLSGVARMLLGTAELKRRVPEMALLSSAATFLGTAAPGVLAALIRAGAADLAGFGRQMLAYPDFAADLLQKGGMDPDKICLCCSKCTEIMRTPGGTPGCVIRDREVYLPLYQKIKEKRT